MKETIKISGTVLLASDFHLGISGIDDTKTRENKIVAWLDSYRGRFQHLILVGDIFDYWFEYKSVIPRGFSQFWSKMRLLRDEGIDIYFFTGNHDMWMFDFATQEYGIPILRDPQLFEINGFKTIIHHSDGLGPGDYSYKFIKRVFSNKLAQFFFSTLHPNIGIGLMRFFSGTSRKYGKDIEAFQNKKERQVIYAENELSKNDIDFFIFGHRHLPIDYLLSNKKSRYINLGDWLYHYTYVVFNEDGPKLIYHEK